MIDIQWKGKIGYGDVVSPICYAHNLSKHLEQKVKLTFRWDHGPEHKVAERDPETLPARATFLHSIAEKEGTDVELVHSYNDPLDINHTNYDWSVVGKDQYHNFWLTDNEYRWRPFKGKYIVLNTTLGNIQTLKEYGKSWKDPLGSNWEQVVDCLRYQHKQPFVEVDYRTPVAELVDLLVNARGFIGYHGTAAWVSRYIGTPTVLVAEGSTLTYNSFPTARVRNNVVGRIPEWLSDINGDFRRARKKLENGEHYFTAKYKPPQTTIDHLNFS